MPKPKPPVPRPLTPDPCPLPYIAAPLRPLAEPLEALHVDARNARKHDERNLKSIVASLKEFGQVKPIVVNADGTIEAGNGTYEAARRLGWTHLAAVRVQHDPAAARGYALADNRTAELADWDDAMLQALLAEVQEDSPQLYDDLLLAELRGAGDEGRGAGDGKGKVMPDFSVVVQCADQADQRRFVRQMKKENRACRMLTLSPSEAG